MIYSFKSNYKIKHYKLPKNIQEQNLNNREDIRQFCYYNL